MSIDVKECLNDSNKKEALITEIIVQNLNNGAYVDISHAQSYLEHEHWRDMVVKYANRYGIK